MSLELFTSRQLYNSIPNNFNLDLSNIIYSYSIETDEEKIKRLSFIYESVEIEDIITIHPSHSVTLSYINDEHKFFIGIDELSYDCEYSSWDDSVMILCSGVLLPVLPIANLLDDSLGLFISAAKYFTDNDTDIILVASAIYAIYQYVTKIYLCSRH